MKRGFVIRRSGIMFSLLGILCILLSTEGITGAFLGISGSISLAAQIGIALVLGGVLLVGTSGLEYKMRGDPKRPLRVVEHLGKTRHKFDEWINDYFGSLPRFRQIKRDVLENGFNEYAKQYFRELEDGSLEPKYLIQESGTAASQKKNFPSGVDKKLLDYAEDRVETAYALNPADIALKSGRTFTDKKVLIQLARDCGYTLEQGAKEGTLVKDGRKIITVIPSGIKLSPAVGKDIARVLSSGEASFRPKTHRQLENIFL